MNKLITRSRIKKLKKKALNKNLQILSKFLFFYFKELNLYWNEINLVLFYFIQYVFFNYIFNFFSFSKNIIYFLIKYINKNTNKDFNKKKINTYQISLNNLNYQLYDIL